MTIDAAKYLLLPKKDAQNLAEKDSVIFRLIRVDDRNILPYPEDIRNDRICVEVEKNKVVKATVQ
jgi:hypothetical protein